MNPKLRGGERGQGEREMPVGDRGRAWGGAEDAHESEASGARESPA